MGRILSYSILSGLVLLAMFLAYKLFIARDNRHNFNRGILLSIYVFSFSVIPLYNIVDIMLTAKMGRTINMVEMKDQIIEISSEPIWGTFLIWVFIVGMSVVTIRTLITWIKIISTICSGYKIKKDDFTLVVINNDKIAPFSWMSYMVINYKDFIENDSAITTHELKHIRSFHYIDMLIAQLVCILNWFNPAAWLMREELILVHEYQADLAVINSGHDPRDYQKLLIKKAVGSRFPSLANSINHSKLKKRITMMYKSKNDAGSKIKVLALVPMIALAFVVISTPIVRCAVSTISNSDFLLNKGNENLAESAQFRITSLIDSGTETTIVVEGEGVGNSVTVSGGTFTNKGMAYSAKSLISNMTNGNISITAVFPFSDNYQNAGVTLTINDKDVTLYLEEFQKKSQSKSLSISSPDGIIISEGDSTLSLIGDMEIFLDGKKISKEEMKAINPENIASMSIDKQNNCITIKTK